MDLPLIYHPGYVAPLPHDHRFPMAKFKKLYEMLLADGVGVPSQFFSPQCAPQEWNQQLRRKRTEYETATFWHFLRPKGRGIDP